MELGLGLGEGEGEGGGLGLGLLIIEPVEVILLSYYLVSSQ